MTQKIDITVTTKFKPLRAAYSAALQIGVIYIGVVVGSAAMQWMGFLLLVLLCIVLTIAHSAKEDIRKKELTGLTIDQARAKIDEIARTSLH